jgi:hypothetical protein
MAEKGKDERRRRGGKKEKYQTMTPGTERKKDDLT